MDFDEKRREGPHPAIIPNAGRRQAIYWTLHDVEQYAALLRKAFPRIVFYENFGSVDELQEKPSVRFLNRLDVPNVGRNVDAFIPYDGWQPELVRAMSSSKKMRWTWGRYLSPRLHFSLGHTLKMRHLKKWPTEPEVPAVETWPSTSILTSYRRELPEERRISDRFVGLARKLCIRTVPIRWESSREFRDGRGKVARVGFMVGDGWATQAAANWCLAAPDRILGFETSAAGGAHGCLPLERVPDSWWGDIRKPKWAQRP